MYCPFAKESSYTRMHSPLADQHTKLEKLQEDGEQQYDFEYVVGVFVHGSALTRRQPAGSVHVGRDGEHPESFDAGQGVSRSGCMWARGYQLAFSCFPRLHVITKTDQFPKAKRFLRGIPNVTYRENAFTQAVEDAGSYIMIQWHLVWADNFTTAPHILFFDVDAVPILPLQCHHLFDDSERPMLYAWRYNRPTHWTQPDSAIMQAAQLRGETFPRAFTATMANLDFMTFWPIVAPRYVLPELRRLVTAASNESYFDAAWIALVHGSHQT